MSDSVQTMEKRKRRIVPSCAIREEAGKVRIILEMPGVRKEDLEIKIEKGELIIEGRRDDPVPRGSYLMRERASGDFVKTFTLDDTIDTERVNAELKDGILDLSLSLKEAAKPRKIEIT